MNYTVVADGGLSLSAISQFNSESDGREHGNLIEFSRLDRYFALIADWAIAV
jgi:hypothetical protein